MSEVKMYTTYHQVRLDNPYMKLAYETAKGAYLLRKFNAMPLPVAVLVRHGKILNVVASGYGQHQIQGYCDRMKHQVPSGTRYDLCEFCGIENHAEALVVAGIECQGADVYVYGHYYFCEACKEALRKADVRDWYILHDADKLFDVKHPACVIGKPEQFEK